MFQKLLRRAPSRSRSAKNFSTKPFAPAASVAFSTLFLSCIVNIQVSVGVFNATTFGAASSNGEGDCLGAKLRPGNVHSAEDWEEVLLPEIERQQELGKEVVFRADAAFAKPEITVLQEGGWAYNRYRS